MRTRQLSTLPLVLIAASGLVIGLAVPAAAHEASHLINGASIKPHSISGDRLKNNTVTGAQIKESTLGTVPSAKTAATAATATEARSLPALVWHPLTLTTNWTETYPTRPASYAVDAQGLVHLDGAISCSGSCGDPAFTLPATIDPDGIIDVLVYGYHGAIGVLFIDTDGSASVDVANGSNVGTVDYLTSLEGITFDPK